jgi:iron-sulfur cluster assembly protein
MLKILSDDDLGSEATPAIVGGAEPADFRLTEKACKQVAKLLAEEQKTKAVQALRVGVRGGGCSGLQYFMEFTGAPEAADHVITQHGVTYYIDKKSAQYLRGGELDFHSSIQSSGFKWKNPNEKKSCGCGESFAV